MTRLEFSENIRTIGNIIEFCWDNNYDEFVEDIIPSDRLDERVCDIIREMTYNTSFVAIRNFLNDIEPGYGYYREDTYFSIGHLTDDDFCDMRDELYERLEDDGFFEEDGEDGDVEAQYFENENAQMDKDKEVEDSEVSDDAFLSLMKITF